MIRFIQNLFCSPEDLHIKRALADTGATAVIAVVHSAPMVGLVERLEFQRKNDRVVASVTRLAGKTTEPTATPEISLAAFDSLFYTLKTARGTLTSRDKQGVKDGESYLLLWGDAARTSRLFVRWPVSNASVRQVLDALLTKHAGTSDSSPL